jgi:hypothetical protein
VRRLIGITLIVLFAFSGQVFAGDKPEVPLPEPTTGCNYCSLGKCGCSPPPTGYYLSFTCSCSSIDCKRSCDYYPL